MYAQEGRYVPGNTVSLTSLQVPHCNLAIGLLALDQFRSSHRGEHRVSAGLSLAIKKDFRRDLADRCGEITSAICMMAERPSFSCARQTNGGVLRINLVIMAMTNVVSGRQIRAGRVLAGLTQAELARAAGCHPRTVRYWESKGINLPTNVVSTLDSIEQALIRSGVIPFSTPTPGVRLL